MAEQKDTVLDISTPEIIQKKEALNDLRRRSSLFLEFNSMDLHNFQNIANEEEKDIFDVNECEPIQKKDTLIGS